VALYRTDGRQFCCSSCCSLASSAQCLPKPSARRRRQQWIHPRAVEHRGYTVVQRCRCRCRWRCSGDQCILFHLSGPRHGQALRRRVVRRLQGILSSFRAQEPRLHVPLSAQLHRRQGQTQPVPLLPTQEVLPRRNAQGRHVKFCDFVDVFHKLATTLPNSIALGTRPLRISKGLILHSFFFVIFLFLSPSLLLFFAVLSKTKRSYRI